MAPHGDAIASSFARKPRLPHLSTDGLLRTKSDMTSQFRKDAVDEAAAEFSCLPPISEVEDAKCECCGMCEEYTAEYIDRVRARYSGKWICGLCAEAVKEEMDRHGGEVREEEALRSHMSACARYKNIRALPVPGRRNAADIEEGHPEGQVLEPKGQGNRAFAEEVCHLEEFKLHACYYQGAQ